MRPLVQMLKEHGLKVWLDKGQLLLGDSLSSSLDVGLSNSSYGVVVLSHSFFASFWAKRELGALHAKSIEHGRSILPVLHRVSHSELLRHSPMLADLVYISTEEGLSTVASAIAEAVGHGRDAELGGASEHFDSAGEYFLWRLKQEVEGLDQEVSNVSVNEALERVRAVGDIDEYFDHVRLQIARILQVPKILGDVVADGLAPIAEGGDEWSREGIDQSVKRIMDTYHWIHGWCADERLLSPPEEFEKLHELFVDAIRGLAGDIKTFIVDVIEKSEVAAESHDDASGEPVRVTVELTLNNHMELVEEELERVQRRLGLD